MGLEITRDEFDEGDFPRFTAKLEANLQALRVLLDRSGFGTGPLSVGAELELNLVDCAGGPADLNREVLQLVTDQRLTHEVNRFNLEINTRPSPLEGRPFAALQAELAGALGTTRRAAAQLGGRIAMIGILPTLEQEHLDACALSNVHRYRALSRGIRRIRGEPFAVRIRGDEELSVQADDVTFEGANTSLQVHLRVDPEAFVRTYNAAQVATAVVLASSGNSPFFLGKRLWHETRVALFRQSVDDRADARDDDWRPARVSFGHGWVRQGARELFEESVALHEPLLPVLGPEDPLELALAGGTPSLAELRLHHGTVWRWKRAVYDDAAGGHLRIEMRAMPAGPTVRDNVSNAAFLVGLTLGLAPRMGEFCTRMTFGHARRNFYQAARRGLEAELLWPESTAPSPRPQLASTLVLALLPVARNGLVAAGVEPAEADARLEDIQHRVATGQTGAVWQRRCHERLLLSHASPRAALQAMLARYLDQSEAEVPVHAWDPP